MNISTPTQNQPAVSRDATLLLVDDQPINLHSASAALKAEGYRLLVARDGQRAIKLAESQQPDLILLDVMMPEMDGYETCRRLKENDTTRDIPVIFLTARNEEDDIAEGFESGGVDYLVKPFRHRELLARVRTHIELRRTSQHLEELNRLKSQFIAMAAHDLKNPLHSISGYTEILLMNLEEGDSLSAKDGSTVEILNTVSRTASHMSRLIHELLETEAVNSGTAAYNPELCDLHALILDVVQLNQGHAQTKNIRMHVSCGLNCYSMVDRRAMHEAFDNLVNNAIKYSPKGRNVWIDLTPGLPTPEMVRFSVRDEGPGLTKEDLEKVFGQFQKLSAKPTGGETSSGLGLSIVKSLVEQQKGRVGVRSDGPGTGATFRIDLPLSDNRPNDHE